MPEVIIVFDGNPEFENLVTSIGYTIAGRVFFKNKRNKINPKYYISKGKIDTIKNMCMDVKCDRIIIDAILKSSQWYKLEKELHVPVDDRVKLIIDIFSNRAKTKESMMQVEYAYLKYEISHIREIIHQMRIGEHPGFMGGGEYEIADYYERIRKKMAKIRRDLEKLKKQREERRKRRKESGYILVGIAGYTNSGKSTLLSALSGKDVVIEDRMFSTLSTKTTKIIREKILITDTVGFVDNMPPWLIKAFEPTLEEIYKADLVLLLFDCKDEYETFKTKFSSLLEILEGKITGKYIPVLNKVDICENLEPKINILKDIGDPVIISAKNGIGIDKLIDRIKLDMDVIKLYAEINENSKIYEYIIQFGKILSITREENIKIVFEIPRSRYISLKNLSDEYSNGNHGVLRII